MTDPLVLAGFLVIAGTAAFIQTLTGFAFGLIMMGAIALAGLMPITDAAVVVGALTIVNVTQMALKGWRLVLRREFALILFANLPMVVVGFLLLEWLAETRAEMLKLALGLLIMISSLQLAAKPAPLRKPSPDASLLGFGVLSGLMGGLFSANGPALVYHLYRQPLPVERIRETLVAIFGVAGMLRLGVVVLTGNLPPPSMAPALLAIPVVMGGTFLARRYPPPIGPAAFRRIVFLLLMASGLSLALPAGLSLLSSTN